MQTPFHRVVLHTYYKKIFKNLKEIFKENLKDFHLFQY